MKALNKISKGQYKYEDENWLIYIEHLIDPLSPGQKMWFPIVYKKSDSELIEYLHIEPANTLQYMKECIEDLVKPLNQ